MLRVIIGDHVEKDRLELREIICRTPGFLLEGETEEGTGLSRILRVSIPHVIFVDIDLPGIDLDLFFKKVEESNPRTFVILMCSRETFPREAMEPFAFHRLFKPLAAWQVEAVIRRMNQIMTNFQSTDILPFGHPPVKIGTPPMQTLIIPADGEMAFLRTNDIIMITRNARKTEIHTPNGIFRVSEPLERIEARLGKNFFRSHKGYIINSDKINGLTLWSNRTYLVRFHDTKVQALMTFERFKLFRQLYCME